MNKLFQRIQFFVECRDAESIEPMGNLVKIVNEYLHKMGYGDTQSLIVRHSDRHHPHLHICINRIGNNGKTISDHNEKYRSTKICRELTERYGLTIGEGKQEVNRSRLRGEDKLRYEIFDTIKSILPQSQTWKDFVVTVFWVCTLLFAFPLSVNAWGSYGLHP